MKVYFSYAAKIGCLAAALSLMAFFIYGYLGDDPTLMSIIFSFAITPFFIGAGVYFIRFKVHQNHISFAEGMTIGFVIYMLNAVISFFGTFIGLQVWPELFERIRANKINITLEKKDFTIGQYGEETFQQTYESIMELSVFQISLNDFIWKIVFGLFFTIIISIILRKTNQ
ncbi:hypothetical protein A33Q_4506 [Indibacter alkaliphilus LW1]|uniref:DUF4199 domain-containing protein n=1 Tax=Indibacter alkaliphilus (strain CCUG 57479 / KCTC 22604 / LW1) TaxID=1189612 RepID=S2DR90_INDAL|nr:DUF4199 domain-containing protein [Indibacter alkaliphilus]EOZ92413.1 hypothetical protein A33Q_4506 [Indibacter alkaliphilus LW1]